MDTDHRIDSVRFTFTHHQSVGRKPELKITAPELSMEVYAELLSIDEEELPALAELLHDVHGYGVGEGIKEGRRKMAREIRALVNEGGA